MLCTMLGLVLQKTGGMRRVKPFQNWHRIRSLSRSEARLLEILNKRVFLVLFENLFSCFDKLN